MSKLLLNKAFSEHHYHFFKEKIPENELAEIPVSIIFQGNKDKVCVEIDKERAVHTSYYIGVDWLSPHKAIYIEPKLNKEATQTNYLKMLITALKHPDVAKHTKGLYEIKFNNKYIEIEQQQDLLTPLLAVHFLKLVQEIVRKGLKKSYYRVSQNLYGKVKGKVLVSESIKQNVFKNKPLNTYCTFDEFGFNNLENRLLKKALLFIQRYLPTLQSLDKESPVSHIFNYIMPAFEEVDEKISLNEIKHNKVNALYKEYTEAIQIAKLILKRFGYSISNVKQNHKVNVPPFWIDMSKLFELYVLGILKDGFGNQIEYHYTRSGNELDYLLNTPKHKMVIDAKYKPVYESSFKNSDIRQISGYARLKSVYDKLNIDHKELIDCLVIYPEKNGVEEINSDKLDIDMKPIKQYVSFFKLGVKLPLLNKS